MTISYSTLSNTQTSQSNSIYNVLIYGNSSLANSLQSGGLINGLF